MRSNKEGEERAKTSAEEVQELTLTLTLRYNVCMTDADRNSWLWHHCGIKNTAFESRGLTTDGSGDEGAGFV